MEFTFSVAACYLVPSISNIISISTLHSVPTIRSVFGVPSVSEIFIIYFSIQVIDYYIRFSAPSIVLKMLKLKKIVFVI